MLKYPEPYTSRVRIRESFQAAVPEWSDQISKYASFANLELLFVLNFLHIHLLLYDSSFPACMVAYLWLMQCIFLVKSFKLTGSIINEPCGENCSFPVMPYRRISEYQLF